MEMPISNSTTTEVTYTGTKGTHLEMVFQPNSTDSRPGDRRRWPPPHPNATNFNYDTSAGNSIYHGVQVRFQRRMAHGVRFLAYYTFSKSIDDTNAIGVGTANSVVQDWRNPAGDRGLSSFDMRHQFRSWVTWELPFGDRGRWLRQGWIGDALSNWRVAPNLILNSGAHITPLIYSLAADPSGAIFAERPNESCNPNLPASQRSPVRYFNTSCFTFPDTTPNRHIRQRAPWRHHRPRHFHRQPGAGAPPARRRTLSHGRPAGRTEPVQPSQLYERDQHPGRFRLRRRYLRQPHAHYGSRPEGTFLMRRLLATLAAASLLAPFGPAQDKTPSGAKPAGSAQAASASEDQAVFRVTVNMVLIDARVTDRSGKPIKGLTPEQFTLLEDGKPQKISSLDYHDLDAMEAAGLANQPTLVVPLGVVQPPPEVQKKIRDRRLIVLFFDQTALQPDELMRSKEGCERFLRDQMTPADLVALAVYGNQLKITVPFTNDRERLMKGVQSLMPGKDSQLAAMQESSVLPGEDSISEDTGNAFTPDEMEFNIFNTDRKLAALESLAEVLRVIPGRKNVIHFTGGITQTGEENRSQLRISTNAANRADVSFYTVDSRGLFPTVPGGEARMGASAGSGAVCRRAQSYGWPRVQPRHVHRHRRLSSGAGPACFAGNPGHPGHRHRRPSLLRPGRLQGRVPHRA